MEELANKNVEVYNLMNRLGIKKKCFPNSTFVENMKKDYVYNDDFIRKMVDKYPVRKLLRKNETAVYMYLARHHILYDYYDKETGIKVGSEINDLPESVLNKIDNKHGIKVGL